MFKDHAGFKALTHNALRIVAGFLFTLHGVQKLFGGLGGNQVEALMSQRGIAGILEFFGGLLIMVGLFTRPVAFLVSGQMAVAYFIAHAPNGFWPIMNRGELAAFYCFTWLFFCAHGAGKYSIDGWLAGRKSASAE
ncbi:MAG: DoxX family protein [Gemmatimonadota bacterium]|nr:DoxX family protein [Gemmatimonadota bacterium]